jgi:hypothetical protein
MITNINENAIDGKMVFFITPPALIVISTLHPPHYHSP